MNDHRIVHRPKPIARSVPISRVRRETAAYIVLVAANALPMAMMIATENPSVA